MTPDEEVDQLVDEYEVYIRDWWVGWQQSRRVPTRAIRTLAEGLVKLKQESERVTNYHLVGDPDTQRTFRRYGEFAHQHDDEVHAHEGGNRFHHHAPGVPPGFEPAFLEG